MRKMQALRRIRRLLQKKNIDKYIDKWIELRKKHYLKTIDLKKMAEESSADEIKSAILKTMEFSRSKIDIINIKDAVSKTKDYILAGDINILKVNASNEIDFGAALNLSFPIEGPIDGGAIALFDMPVTSSSASGTEMSATIRIDSTNILKAF